MMHDALRGDVTSALLAGKKKDDARLKEITKDLSDARGNQRVT